MAQKLYARIDTNALRLNQLNLGDADKFIIVKSIEKGTLLNVMKFENINLGRGIKKYAVLNDGLYVDADFLSAESLSPPTTKKEKKKFNWAYFAIGIAVVGGVYLGGRRLFRKR
jgi:hypothetical protein